MKLPFSFGTNLLFRLVLPGLILAGAIAPGIEALLRALWTGSAPDPLTYIPLLVVFLGWLISLCDMPIYMAFEGRRFWPTVLVRRGIRAEERRLGHLLEAAEQAHRRGDVRRHLELSVLASQFPLGPDGRPYAAMPTRLGNLIYEYELYPLRKYGLDSVFFYYRLWVAIDHELRDELDSKQATVDAALYVVAAVLVMALCLAGYGTAQLAAGAAFPWLGPGWVTLALAAACVVLAALIYRLSLPAHAQYGEFYKALFDQHRNRIEFTDLLDYLARATGDPDLAHQDFRNANQAVWRYLRWHRVRLHGESRNRNVEEVIAARAERPPAPAAEPREGSSDAPASAA